MRNRSACVCALLLALLASCGGGGGGSAPDAPPPTAAAIRFEVVYDPVGLPPGATAPARYLTVRSLPGSASLSSAGTAGVQLVLAQEAPRALTAPTYVDAQGRANYVFTVSPDYPATFAFRSCTSFLPFQLTVTDASGLAFTKYSSLCPGQAMAVGAFSDYGDRTATFTAAGPPGVVQASFRRSGPGGYVDTGSSIPAGGSATWTLRAAAGDQLAATAVLATTAAEGAIVTADVTADGGALAHSVVAKNTAIGATFVDASLLCCGAAAGASASTATQTVSFSVAPAQLGSIPGGVVPSVPFNVHYRVVDGASQRVTAEFEGQGTGYSTWTSQARPGDLLAIEASPQAASAMVDVSVSYGSGPALVFPALGTARSFVAGVPARLDVVCCAPAP